MKYGFIYIFYFLFRCRLLADSLHVPFLLFPASLPPLSDDASDEEGDEEEVDDVALDGEGMELSGLDWEDSPGYWEAPPSSLLPSLGGGLCGNTWLYSGKTNDVGCAVGIMAGGKYGT